MRNEKEWREINTALDNYLADLATEGWRRPQNGSTWFNNWRDWLAVEPAQQVGRAPIDNNATLPDYVRG